MEKKPVRKEAPCSYLVAPKVFDNARELSIPSRSGGNVLQRRNEPRLKPGDCVKKEVRKLSVIPVIPANPD